MIGIKQILERLREAGKRNSTSDLKKIQAAHDTMVGLGAACTVQEALRSADSMDSRRSAIAAAVRMAFTDPADPYSYPSVYVRDVFDADVVVQVGYSDTAEMYQLSYSLDADNNVTLGEPVEVDLAYIPSDDGSLTERKIPHNARLKLSGGKKIATKDGMDPPALTEAADTDLAFDFVALKEAAAVDADGNASIKIIAPGWGSSGYYSPEMLKRDGPLAFKSGTKMFWNHQTAMEESERPEGDLDDFAAELTGDAKWQEGAEGPGLYAPAKVFPSYRETVNDLHQSIGVSIRASGRAKEGTAEGRTGPLIEKIAAVKSVDFVTSPGAGGKILQLFEAARGARKNQPKQEPEVDNKQLVERMEALEAANKTLTEAAIKADAQTFVNAKLAEATTLPTVSVARVAELVGRMPVPQKDNRVDLVAYGTTVQEAIAAEAAYIAALTGAGKVSGMGGTTVITDEAKSVTESQAKLDKAFADLCLTETSAKLAAAGRR